MATSSYARGVDAPIALDLDLGETDDDEDNSVGDGNGSYGDPLRTVPMPPTLPASAFASASATSASTSTGASSSVQSHTQSRYQDQDSSVLQVPSRPTGGAVWDSEMIALKTRGINDDPEEIASHSAASPDPSLGLAVATAAPIPVATGGVDGHFQPVSVREPSAQNVIRPVGKDPPASPRKSHGGSGECGKMKAHSGHTPAPGSPRFGKPGLRSSGHQKNPHPGAEHIPEPAPGAPLNDPNASGRAPSPVPEEANPGSGVILAEATLVKSNHNFDLESGSSNANTNNTNSNDDSSKWFFLIGFMICGFLLVVVVIVVVVILAMSGGNPDPAPAPTPAVTTLSPTTRAPFQTLEPDPTPPPTTKVPSTPDRTTVKPTTDSPTTNDPTTIPPTTPEPTTSSPATPEPTTESPTPSPTTRSTTPEPTISEPSPTESPATNPSSVSLTGWEADLPDYTQLALENPNSAQTQALNWLNQHPNLYTMEVWKRRQLLALVSFYFSYQGDQWTNTEQSNWLSVYDDECTWGDTGNDRNTCNADGRINKLSLEEQNGIAQSVRGSTPAELAMLTDLTELDVFTMDLFNGLDVVLPPQLSSLTDLNTIRLSYNELTGTLPAYLKDFQALTNLNIRNNDLTGKKRLRCAYTGLSFAGIFESSTVLFTFFYRLATFRDWFDDQSALLHCLPEFFHR